MAKPHKLLAANTVNATATKFLNNHGLVGFTAHSTGGASLTTLILLAVDPQVVHALGRVTTTSIFSMTGLGRAYPSPKFWFPRATTKAQSFWCGTQLGECLKGPASHLVVLQSRTKDAEGARKARSKHSTHSARPPTPWSECLLAW